MSMHKIPLTPPEEEGLRLHGLPIGTPSQRSDTFRQGVAWGIGEAKRLTEENERRRKDAAVGAAIQRAAKELPVGAMIEITVENGSDVVVIYYGCGGWDTMDVDAENRLASEINAAIDAARGAK